MTKRPAGKLRETAAVVLSVAHADGERGHITHHPSATLTLLGGGAATWRERERGGGRREKEGGCA